MIELNKSSFGYSFKKNNTLKMLIFKDFSIK
jgi:hypothetical protein